MKILMVFLTPFALLRSAPPNKMHPCLGSWGHAGSTCHLTSSWGLQEWRAALEEGRHLEGILCPLCRPCPSHILCPTIHLLLFTWLLLSHFLLRILPSSHSSGKPAKVLFSWVPITSHRNCFHITLFYHHGLFHLLSHRMCVC